MNGYTKRELEDIQRTWKLRFPPDLVNIYLQRRSVIESDTSFDWIKTPSRKIRDMIEWPIDSILRDVRGGDWWPEWGDRPWKDADAEARFIEIAEKAPKLIPVHGHRYVPETPHESGNPVFSVYGSDTIYYGANLADYATNENSGMGLRQPILPTKTIPFWSRLVELNGANG